MKNATDVLQNFFEITGNETDSLVFLKSFRSLDPEKFALIYANTEVVLESFSGLYYNLKVLYSLGLYPVILVGYDSISYIELFFRGIFNTHNDSSKGDDPECDILQFSSNLSDNIKISIKNKRIPFVVLESEDNLFQMVSGITGKLLTSKFLYLTSKGSLRKINTNERISIINIRSDYQEIAEGKIISHEEMIFLDLLKNLLEKQISHTMNIAITSPLTLLKELFTVNGKGTFIKLGSEIMHFETINQVDKGKLKQLLESAFSKTIKPDFLDSTLDSIFLESNYRGAAILKKTKFGALLSKFAVDEIARGEGIGRDIWNEMIKKHQTIFWRAKPENQIHKWYAKECQGMDRGKNWNIYWINLDVTMIPLVCQYLRTQEEDFIV